MTQQDDRLGAVANPDLQVVAGVGPPVPDGGDPNPLLEEPADLVRAGIAARLVQRGRLRDHQVFKGSKHGGPVGPLHRGAVHAKT